MLDTAVAYDYAVIRTNSAEAPQAMGARSVDDGADRKGDRPGHHRHRTCHPDRRIGAALAGVCRALVRARTAAPACGYGCAGSIAASWLARRPDPSRGPF